MKISIKKKFDLILFVAENVGKASHRERQEDNFFAKSLHINYGV
jgi:hypothetical protein